MPESSPKDGTESQWKISQSHPSQRIARPSGTLIEIGIATLGDVGTRILCHKYFSEVESLCIHGMHTLDLKIIGLPIRQRRLCDLRITASNGSPRRERSQGKVLRVLDQDLIRRRYVTGGRFHVPSCPVTNLTRNALNCIA
jgi:hypothetical protein